MPRKKVNIRQEVTITYLEELLEALHKIYSNSPYQDMKKLTELQIKKTKYYIEKFKKENEQNK